MNTFRITPPGYIASARSVFLPLLAALGILVSGALGSSKASADTIFAVAAPGNILLRFDSATPGALIDSRILLGLQMGESLVGIDFRPATGQLYGIGSASRLYIINTQTATATQVGMAGAFALAGTSFGFDFNPVPDRIRVTSNTEQNLRLNPNDGALTMMDTSLAYAMGDDNQGANPNIAASAYTNNVSGATSTTLYAIDSLLDTLVIQNPPNAGALNTVGALGVAASDVAGFDISTNLAAEDSAFAVLNTAGASNLYTIDLATGAAALIGAVGGGFTVQAIALAPTPVTLFALTPTNLLLSFESAFPSNVAILPILGLPIGESIVGIDSRPATGVLYGLGDSNRIYTINTQSGAAMAVGAGGAFALTGTSFGFDFNPVPDRIRVTSNTEQNLRLNPNDGTLTMMDTALAYAMGDANVGANPNIAGSAYTNNFAGATMTTLYGIDSELDILATQIPPNDGILNTVGALGVDVSEMIGFDIVTTNANIAFAALTVGGDSRLYVINLANGSATLIGSIGGILEGSAAGAVTRNGMGTILGLAAALPTPAPTPTPTPTPAPTPRPAPEDDGGSGCSIAGGTASFGTAAANLILALIPAAFAVGARILRKRIKK